MIVPIPKQKIASEKTAETCVNLQCCEATSGLTKTLQP